MKETTLSGESLDILSENISKLKELFPEIVTEDKIDFDKFKQVFGNYVEDSPERYNFTWKGKSAALRLAQTPSTGTLRPCKEESKNWDRTENLYIEGDNLEVLKLLQKSYYGKIKMIYIDPPYNTGRDFIYKDSFSDNLKNYLQITGQLDESGNKISTKTDISGRYHTNWLNMMYPRLRLARNLLNEEGVIFISIDDNEVDNLKKMCNEIFGEENFIGCAGRITKKSNNKGDFWAPNFDYILTYTKNIRLTHTFFGGANIDAYNLVEEDGPRKGEKYQLVRLYMSTIQNRNPEQRFWIECPDGSNIIPPGSTFPPERPALGDGIWRWTRKKFNKEQDKIVIKKVRSSNLLNDDKKPAKWNVYTKTYLNDVIANSSAKPNSFIEGHINQIGSHELNKLKIPFDYSKPSTLIKYLKEVSKTKDDDIVLDFFSGSATTADAVIQFNSEYGSSCKFIMIQIPEPVDEKSEAFKENYLNICEIGKERIRRAGDKIVSEMNQNGQTALDSKLNTDLDIGFKVFKLDSSNLSKWDPEYDNLEQTLLDSVENLVPGRNNLDLVYEIMLKYGINLTLPIKEYQIQNKKFYSIGFGALIICLDDNLTSSLASEIIKLKDELSPEVMRVVFKDNGFASDSDKTNIKETLKTNGIEEFVTI
ncbi:MAG: site-specific DNA-methyltransferase [Methanobacteriaceae archaeon]|nr:site-specific DNA-methyltransferase [Methanobacteriaceae archaeon]